MSRKGKSQRNWVIGISAVVVCVVLYWMSAPDPVDDKNAVATTDNSNSGILLSGVSDDQPALSTSGTPSSPAPAVTARPLPQPAAQTTITPQSKPKSAVARGEDVLRQAQNIDKQGQVIQARTLYSEAMRLGITESQQRIARQRLLQIADEAIFSAKRLKADRLVSNYVIQSGDHLDKIAKRHQVTSDLLAKVNGLESKNKIRAGQNLKMVEGPFHAHIYKSEHTMRVFLQDTLVREYRVGLGEDGSTPTGEWRVKNKLTNPTYYPPRGGDIILADDPENPLGEHWIGLEGVSGEALNQQRYGIHGTIDSTSIGSNASLGCVRLHNDDVEEVFSMLVEKNSKVFIHE